ncbi:MAG: 3-oxoacyl-ACP synthase [candidate division Zixibacteria bacterium 4484_93]|nr:MAG: 3-oxoacyl-ACP synthase [candidate division Zixibacteria bacterium 4484_93]RKZ34444.1 MAG: 3-oxoacyl-ACP synthase [bacterium]
MAHSYIKGLGAYVPDGVLSNADLEKIVETSDKWITTRSGIKTRHISDENTPSSELATEAAKIALDNAGMEASELDLVLLGTVCPDMLFPSTACLVAHKLGTDGIPAFDFSAGCTGFIYGLAIADSFIKSGFYKNILVIGVEELSKLMNWNDRGTCVLFGDGAGAAIVSPTDDSKKGILDWTLSANGFYGDFIRMPAGGSMLPASKKTVRENLHTVFMKGNEVFKLAIRLMTDAGKTVLERSGVSPQEVAWLVPHQANIRIMEAVASRLGIPKERVVITIDKYGNTSAASIPMAMYDARDRFSQGDYILLVAFGSGFTWGSVLLRW